MNRINHLSLLSLTVMLAACGGGDGGASGPSSNIEATTASAAPAAGSVSSSAAPSQSPASSLSPAPTPTPTPAPAPAPSASLPAAQTCGLADFQQQILDRVNQARASSRMCGSTAFGAVAPVAWNARLFDAAAGHAQDMATNNYFSHVGQDGRSFSQRVTDAGYTWSAVGENIAAGQASVDEVMNSWLQSPGHCENIMNGNYTEVAVSCARNDASTYKQYWVMELGRPG